MTDFEVLTLKDADAWRQFWRQLSPEHRDVFARPEYYAAFDGIEGAVAECAVLTSAEGCILYPYLRQPIHRLEWLGLDSPCFDLCGAYGYGGPLGDLHQPGLWDRFAAQFGDYCRAVGVVAEFVRVHPLLGAAQVMGSRYNLSVANYNVIVDLQRDDEQLWKSYKHNNRKNINKARACGVQVHIECAPPDHFERYLDIYHATMDRRQASDDYRFPLRFYQTLHHRMPEAMVYFFAEYEGRMVSCELCLLSETSLYSFLGGTEEAAFPMRPNNLLKHEAIRWARDRGLQRYVLGGGAQMLDGIFEYKRSFAPDGIVEFHIAKRVHDPQRYADLVDRCERSSRYCGEEARRWFLRWRFPISGERPVT